MEIEGIKRLVEEQHMFFKINTTKNIGYRIEQLKTLEKLLRSNEKRLFDAIYKDFGKSEFDTYSTELAFVYLEINEAIRSVRKWSSQKSVPTNLINFPARSYVIPEPLGVSLVIGAWNYPFHLSLVPAIAAIAAGCTVVLKPSELPSRTSSIMAELINTTFDTCFFHVVEGGIPETTALLNQKFDKIFFTGSVPVGRIVYQAAAKNLTPVTLELGGKSPAIVTENAHLKMSAKRLVWAKFINAGQTCIAPDYVVVHTSVKERFLAYVKEEIVKAQYAIENANYTQIIDAKNMKRLVSLIDTEKCIYGGKYDQDKRVIEPTVLSGITFDHPTMDEEIFGPILPVLEYESLNTIIQEVKDRPRPLACYVFTQRRKEKDKILRELSFGNGGVNEAIMQISNPNLAFGGVGDSGIGNYHGKHGFDAFTHYKSILDKPTWLETNLKYYKPSKWKYKLVRWLLR
jgi:aldehyde dehydrogenase (NAD+)